MILARRIPGYWGFAFVIALALWLILWACDFRFPESTDDEGEKPKIIKVYTIDRSVDWPDVTDLNGGD